MPDLTTVERCKQFIGGIPNGEILDVGITSEGSGYHAATTTLALSGVFGQGTGFSAVPVIVGGKIVNVVILNPGKLYLKDTPPTLTATDTDISPGTGAVFTLVSTADKPRIAPIDSTADALLAALVSAASAFFMTETCRSHLIANGAITEIRNGHVGQRYMATLETPVTAVSSLIVDGRVIAASPGPLSSGFGFDREGVFVRGTCFSEGFQNIQVVYSAGYDPDSPEAAEIAQAVTELVAQKYERRKHVDLNSRGTSIAGGSSTTAFSQKDVPPEVQTVIDRFTRPLIVGGG